MLWIFKSYYKITFSAGPGGRGQILVCDAENRFKIITKKKSGRWVVRCKLEKKYNCPVKGVVNKEQTEVYLTVIIFQKSKF